MGKQKTFKPVAVLARTWKVSELWIWKLSITGWETAAGKHRKVERRWDKFLGSVFAEEDIQSWVDSNPVEYIQRTMPR